MIIQRTNRGRYRERVKERHRETGIEVGIERGIEIGIGGEIEGGNRGKCQVGVEVWLRQWWILQGVVTFWWWIHQRVLPL
jgi:hypothetical protein